MNISATQPTTPTIYRNPVSAPSATGNTVDGGTASAAGSSKVGHDRSVDLSNSGKLISADTRQGLLQLGMMALGKSTVADWASKGLEVSEEALIEAARAFQEGFKQAKEAADQAGTSTAGYGLSINKHQIVGNHQDVPDWFIKEYDTALAMIDEPAHQESFRKGALFFVSPPATTDRESLTYQSVASYS